MLYCRIVETFLPLCSIAWNWPCNRTRWKPRGYQHQTLALEDL